MRIMVACEFSGTVRDAFIERGHDARSCDLLPSESNMGAHYTGDWRHFVAERINNFWIPDLFIGHPPCTYLANSGVRWLKDNPQRWENMREGAQFFKDMWDMPFDRICLENPIQHKHCGLPKPTQIVQPWMFGDNETKAVCLWLKNLPPLVPWVIKRPEKVEARVWKMPPGPNRQKERSRFFPGIARAMAEQWGNLPIAP